VAVLEIEAHAINPAIQRNIEFSVPEHFTLSLFGAGLFGAAAMRRRKKSKQA
jgi:hypothetical protein